MIGYIRTIASDFMGLCRVGGIGLGVRWLFQVVLRCVECRRRKNLQAADWATGEGPFLLRAAGSEARVVGEGVLTGVRETWIRGVYTGSPGMEQMPDSGVFLDLGASMGTVTLMALGRGPGVRAVAVESSPWHVGRLKRQLAANGWESRTEICHAFIGGILGFQAEQKAGEAATVPTVSEEALIEKYQLTKIAYLKCDIEGSEFELFKPGSKLLAMTERLAIEVHDKEGDRGAFLEMLRREGFKVTVWRDDIVCCMVHAVR